MRKPNNIGLHVNARKTKYLKIQRNPL